MGQHGVFKHTDTQHAVCQTAEICFFFLLSFFFLFKVFFHHQLYRLCEAIENTILSSIYLISV